MTKITPQTIRDLIAKKLRLQIDVLTLRKKKLQDSFKSFDEKYLKTKKDA